MAKPKDIIAQIKKAARRKFSADDMIRIVLEDLRGQASALSHRQFVMLSLYRHLLVILRIDYFVLSALLHC